MDEARQGAAAAGSASPAAASVSVRIPGEPVAQGRPRAFRVGDGVRMFDPPKSRAWKGVAQIHMQHAMAGLAPLDGPLEITIVCVWSLPRSHERNVPVPRRWRPQRPDAENVVKACLDAGNGVLYRDDAQVVRVVAEKWTGAQGESPGVLIEVRSLHAHSARAEQGAHVPTGARVSGPAVREGAAGQLALPTEARR